MNICQIDSPNLCTSEIIQAAYENRLYCGLTNISRQVLEVYYSIPEDLWYEEEFVLNDLSIGGID